MFQVQLLKKWIVAKYAEKNHPMWNQVIFVRDRIPGLIVPNYEQYELVSNGVLVVGTHTSRSVELPVFEIIHPDGLKFVLRYNFYDWKVSVESTCPITADFKDLFSQIEACPYYNCEGFPQDRVYGPYTKDNCRFTIELRDEYQVYTFFWLVGAALKLRS